MSGSIGIPPGTQWLQNSRKNRRKSQDQAISEALARAPPVVQQAAMDTPAKGAWQYRVMPQAGVYDEDANMQWMLQHSPPESDEWSDTGVTNNVVTLGAFLHMLRGLND